MTTQDDMDELRADIEELRSEIGGCEDSGAAEEVFNKVDIEIRYLWADVQTHQAEIEDLREIVEALQEDVSRLTR